MEQEKHLITLTSVPAESDAAPIVTALNEHGISATMTGGFTAGFIAEAPGDIQIKIFERDREQAKQVLRQFKMENESIDWSKVDVGDAEDETGSLSRVSQIITICLMMIVPVIIGFVVDQNVGTSFAFTLLGLIIGMTGAVFQLVGRADRKLERKDRKPERTE